MSQSPRPTAGAVQPQHGHQEPDQQNDNSLFMDQTISKDDTVGGLSAKQKLLSQFNGEPGRGMQLMRPSQYVGAGSPEPQMAPPPPMMGGPPPMPRPQHLPPPPPPPPQSGFPGSNQVDSDDEALDGESFSIWPEFKSNENARWRRVLSEARGPPRRVGAASSSEMSNGPELQVNGDALSARERPKEYTDGGSTTRPGIDSTSAMGAAGIGKDQNGLVSEEQDQQKPLDTIEVTSIPVPEDQPQKTHNLDRLPNTLAESLSAVAEKFLKIDVLDQKQEVSRYIAYLLDTIDLCHSRIDYLEAKNPIPSTEEPSLSSSSPTQPAKDDSTNAFVGRVIHRVFCINRRHQHDTACFEDEPTYKDQHYKDEAKLTGEKLIQNMDTYVNRQPHISFLIIKEHDCTKSNMSHDILGRRVDRFVSSERAERIRIVSPLLQKALTHVGEYHPFPLMFNPDLERALEIDAPYLFLFHHREKLNDLAQDEKYKDVLCPLLQFLAANYSKEYEEADHLFREGAVTAYHVSKLFKPGQMVISRQQKTDILEAHVLGPGVKIERDKINLFGWSWAFDGTQLQRAMWGQQMESVPDERVPIKDLKIHPAEFAQNEDVEYLVERGKKFWDLRDQTYVCYTGWDCAHEHHYTKERFMVDMSTYKLMHAASHPIVPPMLGGPDDDGHEPTKFDPWPRRIKKSKELSDEKFMLLPSSIFGFRLQAKKWTKLLIENFHGVEWNRKAFERLVLDEAAKKMIYALVDVQKSAGKMDDIIAGKGNGLIVLLHGSPGTGKTLTAESVAEIAEKPLYRVTCGDIGTEAKDVENYLETVLYLGKTWDCVLLLDEADVFLEERTMADLQRNSLVSVFLRTLEYYEGILILTSNRVGTFDEAFKSRIQVAIHYENLTKKSRKAIWRNLFDMIEESEDEDANIVELERRLDELASHEMNGRQIRNALLTARQLAKHQGDRLDWKHLSQVMKTSADFNKYLKTVKGHSDDQWAREEMLR